MIVVLPVVTVGIANNRYFFPRTAVGSIQTARTDGFDGLCRQNASSECNPPGANTISG
jgi:hypothetical protein